MREELVISRDSKIEEMRGEVGRGGKLSLTRQSLLLLPLFSSSTTLPLLTTSLSLLLPLLLSEHFHSN